MSATPISRSAPGDAPRAPRPPRACCRSTRCSRSPPSACSCSLVTLNAHRRRPRHRPTSRATPTTTSTARRSSSSSAPSLAIVLSRVDYSRLRELKYGLYGLLMASILLVLAVGSAATRLAARDPAAVLRVPGLRARQGAARRRAGGVRRRPLAAPRRARHDGAGHAARAGPGGLRDAPARPRLGPRLRRDRARRPVRRRHAVAALRRARSRSAAVAIALVLVAAPAAGVDVLKPYQVDRLTSFLNPTDNPAERGLPAEPVADRDRRPARRPAAATTRRRRSSTSCPSTTRTSSSPWSASAGASSAPRSCCRSTRCSSGAACAS